MKTYWYCPQWGICESLNEVPTEILSNFDFTEISELVAEAILLSKLS